MAHEAMEYDLQVQLNHAEQQPAPAGMASSQGGPALLQPVPADVVSSQGVPSILQPAPAEVISSQATPPLLQPAPQLSVDLTEVEVLGEDNVENINPRTSEQHRQGSDANHTIPASSLHSMTN
ncbi:RFWD3 isoform 6, partial [Pan troglodytes]